MFSITNLFYIFFQIFVYFYQLFWGFLDCWLSNVGSIYMLYVIQKDNGPPKIK